MHQAAEVMKRYKNQKAKENKPKYQNFEQRNYTDEFYRTIERGGNKNEE